MTGTCSGKYCARPLYQIAAALCTRPGQRKALYEGHGSSKAGLGLSCSTASPALPLPYPYPYPQCAPPAHEHVVLEVRAAVQEVVEQQHAALVLQPAAHRLVQGGVGHARGRLRAGSDRPRARLARLRRRLLARVAGVLSRRLGLARLGVHCGHGRPVSPGPCYPAEALKLVLLCWLCSENWAIPVPPSQLARPPRALLAPYVWGLAHSEYSKRSGGQSRCAGTLLARTRTVHMQPISHINL